LITTSNYSKEAVEFVSKIDSKIILIDGEQLVDYMIDFNVGVTTMAIFEIKKVDSDYFFEE
jgi:restriction system protein